VTEVTATFVSALLLPLNVSSLSPKTNLISNSFSSDRINCQYGKVSLQFKEVIFSRNQLIHQESQLCIILIINRLSKGFQKGVFCISKGHLLHIKRCPFAM